MELIIIITILAICITTIIALIAFTKMCFKIASHIDYLEEIEAIKMAQNQAEAEITKIEKELNNKETQKEE